jgi:hypothetical protein
LVFGGLGEAYIPGQIITASAATTARNVVEHHTLFRLGFATYLVEAVCDIGLAIVWYVLLKPVDRVLALASAFFGLASTVLYAFAEAFYFAPSLVLSGAAYLNAFTPDQLNTLALLSFRLFARIAAIFGVFYGLPTMIRGYLVFRSGFLPRIFGVVLVIMGAGFTWQNFAVVLGWTPASGPAPAVLMAPMVVGLAALTIWLLVKGVDIPRWEARAASRAAQLV